VKRWKSIFYDHINTHTSGTQRRRDRAISSYNYIRRRESFEKIGCSIGLEREQPLMKVVTVKFGGSKGSGRGYKISFSMGTWFPVLSR